MMKKLQLISLLILSIAVTIDAQLTELKLHPDSVITGPYSYPGPSPFSASGYPSCSASILNDDFIYDPDNPLSTIPDQSWIEYPNCSYVLMFTETDLDRDWSDFDFPTAGIDSNFLAINFKVPAGKRIKYLDCWGPNKGGSIRTSKDIVIKLKSANAQWFYVDWDGISDIDSPEMGFGRFDFQANGVTDNLLTTATQISLVRTDRTQLFILAELRLAVEGYTAPKTKPVLTNSTSGSIVIEDFISGTCNEDGTVYLVPNATYSSMVDVQQAAVSKMNCKADVVFVLSTSGLDPGDYRVIAINGGNILSDASTIIRLVRELNVQPVANAGANQTVDPGTIVTLDGSGSSDANMSDTLFYTWISTTDVSIDLSDSTAIKPTFTAPNIGGQYLFELVVNDGKIASAISNVKITVTENVSAKEVVSNTLKIYPNPSDNGFMLDLSNMKEKSIVSIVNICGVVNYTEVLSTNKHQINTDLLPSGIYLLKVENNTRTLIERILIK